MFNLVKKIKELYRKTEVRNRKKDTDEEVAKVIKIEDYGDYNIQIVYVNDYINKSFSEEDLNKIEPYIVFSIIFDIDKEDITKDFYNNLLPFLDTIPSAKYTSSYDSENRKLYSYVGLYGFSLDFIFDMYYSKGKNISFILSNMIQSIYEELNNTRFSQFIPMKFINQSDELPDYKGTFRTTSTSTYNILGIDKIPNVNNIFSTNQLVYMANIYICMDYIKNQDIGYPEGFGYTYSLFKFLRSIYKSADIYTRNKDIIFQIENDAYFTINGINLRKYAQQCKFIKYNIYSDESELYDDVDEVLEENETIGKDSNSTLQPIDFDNDGFDDIDEY